MITGVNERPKRKEGQFKTLEEAVKFKKEQVMKVLEGVDLQKIVNREKV